MSKEIDWAALAAPFAPEDVSFRLQGNPRDGKTSAVVVAYLDARNVQQRLDDVCDPDGWSFDWQPIVTNNSAVLVAKGTLTIAGVSKSDVGDAGQTEPSKASVSDSLKRAAVLFGIGRYLYDLPTMYAECEKHGAGWYMARGEEDKLRTRYLRPASPATRREPPQTATDTSTPSQGTSQPSQTQTHKNAAKPVASDPDAPATAEQRERMRKYRGALEIADRAIASTDNALTVAQAEARICAYIEQWKQRQMKQAKQAQQATPATAQSESEHDLSTLGNGNGGGRH